MSKVDDLFAKPEEVPGLRRVTKIEAARRQLGAAIELWFRDGDAVSIHTLVYAAHEIIHRAFRRRGFRGLMFDSPVIRDEHREAFNLFLKEDANFFKHAEREQDEAAYIDFHEGRNVLFLVVCTHGLQRMGEALTDVESAFIFWIYLQFPEWFPEDVAKETIPIERLNKLRSLTKLNFFEAYMDNIRERAALGLGRDGKPIQK